MSSEKASNWPEATRFIRGKDSGSGGLPAEQAMCGSSAGLELTLKEPKSDCFSSSVSLQGGEPRLSGGLSGREPTHEYHPGF